MAFVIVTHQHPGHVSLLPSLLAKTTQMPVADASDGTVVHAEPRLRRPARRAAGDNRRRLRRLTPNRPACPPADRLFLPLPGDGPAGTRHRRRALGHRRRRHAGYAGDQGRGRHGDGPGTALGQVRRNAGQRRGDRSVRLRPARPGDGAQLIAYARGPYLKTRIPAVEALAFPKEPLDRMLMLVRTRTGHDFTCTRLPPSAGGSSGG